MILFCVPINVESPHKSYPQKEVYSSGYTGEHNIFFYSARSYDNRQLNERMQYDAQIYIIPIKRITFNLSQYCR